MVLIEAWMSQGELVTEPTAERNHLSAPSEQPPVMSCRYMKMPVHTLTTSTVWKQPGADALQRTFLPPFKGHVLAADRPFDLHMYTWQESKAKLPCK